jgi:hypothetical protein
LSIVHYRTRGDDLFLSIISRAEIGVKKRIRAQRTWFSEMNTIKLGMILFRHAWSRGEDISAKSSRKQNWMLGRVGSTDELLQGAFEVHGNESHVTWLGIPNQPIEWVRDFDPSNP